MFIEFLISWALFYMGEYTEVNKTDSAPGNRQ